MDGTLTLAVHDFDEIRRQLGIANGKPILEAIDEMPLQQAQEVLTHLFEIEMKIAKEAKSQPGAQDLLDYLVSRGCLIGILTRNACDIAMATLEAAGLGKYFDSSTILGRESCAPKPDPAGIHMHLSNWKTPPTTTAMVGDYKFDLQSGHSAGVSTVHLDVEQGEHWPEITTVRVKSLTELQSLI